MTKTLLLIFCWIFAMVFSQTASAKGTTVSIPKGHEGFLQGELFGSLLNDSPEHSNIDIGCGFATRAGWRIGKWGAFLVFERSYWLATEIEIELKKGVMNIGLGMERLSFGKRVRSSVAAGTSTLMFNTVFHDVGTTGYFIDIKPVGLRWPLCKWLTVEITPLAVTMMAPVLGEISIKNLEYRTVLTFELSL